MKREAMFRLDDVGSKPTSAFAPASSQNVCNLHLSLSLLKTQTFSTTFAWLRRKPSIHFSRLLLHLLQSTPSSSYLSLDPYHWPWGSIVDKAKEQSDGSRIWSVIISVVFHAYLTSLISVEPENAVVRSSSIHPSIQLTAG